jgi:hypothetical protein
LDLFLSVTALLLVFAAGLGLSLILIPRDRRAGIVEMGSLSFLLGTGFVSLASFCLGFFFRGSLLRWLVSLGCLALGAVAVRVEKRRLISLKLSLKLLAFFDKSGILFSTIILTQIAVVVWLSLHSILGWDGLMIWELKARLAFVNGGSVPIGYYSDIAQEWTHHEYPLFLPLTEAWWYSWLGRSDQGFVKAVFPLFYVAAVGLLYTGGSRLASHKINGFAAAILLFFIPLVIFGGGSVASGYNDFPLAVFYLASVTYLSEYLEAGENSSLHLASALAALSIWVKPEGVVLWLVISAFVVVKALSARDWKAAVKMILPGAIMFGGWKLFLTTVNCPPKNLFMPITPANLWMNLDRTTTLVKWVGNEMINFNSWNLLWPLLLFSLLSLGKNMRQYKYLCLTLSVFLPLALFTAVYIFTNLQPYISHVESSLPRLMLSPSLVAVLTIALTIPVSRKEPASESQSSITNPQSPWIE